MKVTINETEVKSQEIDWSKKMIVKHIEQGFIVQTTGIHKGRLFTGMDIEKSNISSSWVKSKFTPCTTPITVTFEND